MTHCSGNHGKAADRVPYEESMQTKTLGVRKTVPNRRVELTATDSDPRNWRSRHTSGEVSPR